MEEVLVETVTLTSLELDTGLGTDPGTWSPRPSRAHASLCDLGQLDSGSPSVKWNP